MSTTHPAAGKPEAGSVNSNLICAFAACLTAAVLASPANVQSGTLIGHVRDQNWYAVYQNNPPGVGYYEFAVNANAISNSSAAAMGFAGTGIFGEFSMPNLASGSYVLASWDVWWRSSFVFGVNVPASGNSADVDLRLNATMWGYPAFWDDNGYYEFGQTFRATGPVTMFYLRDPLTQNFTRRLTVHAGGPAGPQVGVTRTWGGGGDQRLIYGYGEMPTVAGQTYYVRIRTPSPATGGVLMQMDPRPDFSDPMPGGHLFLGNGTTLTEYPDRDLGLVIMSDDDGLLTSLYARASGSRSFTGTNVGQTFIAQGVSLISAAFWLADSSAPTYSLSVYEGGPGGAKIGPTKRNKPPRLGADPEMIVAYGPGEVLLTPGQTYYLEVSRDDGHPFGAVYANDSNPFPRGQAFENRLVQTGFDLAGTIMEEHSPGSAAQPTVKITSGPFVSETNRGTNLLTVVWTTDVPGDSRVEFAAGAPPYTGSNYVATLTTNHSVTLTGLLEHTMYHYQVASAAPGYRPGVSRDVVICTRNSTPNLLLNPGFEEGTGPSPRTVTGWNTGGGVNLKGADGSWFFSLPPHSGNWFLQGAVNGSTSDGYVYQRVGGVQPGRTYTFSAWVTTWPRENNTWKYDVWYSRNRTIYLRLGIDPSGGTNPNSPAVQWTPRMYSHMHWTDLARTAVAQSTNITVFVSMQGEGVEWHLFGVDDAVLSQTTPLIQDTNPPAVIGVIGHSLTNIQVSFSEPLDPLIAGSLSNFSLPGVAILNAVLQNGTNVILTTTPRLAGSNYLLHISGIADLAVPPNIIPTNTYVPVLVTVPLIPIDSTLRWRYDQSGRNLNTAWRSPTYNDSDWPLGAALFEGKRGTVPSLPEPLRTPLSLTNATRVGLNGTNITFYFRSRFILPTTPSEILNLQLRHVIDDGAIFYLNGQEIYRVGMTNPQPVSYIAFSERTVGDASYEPPLSQAAFTLPATNLVAGENVLGVEVHQVNAGSSDVTFAASLAALVTHVPLLPTLGIGWAGTNLVVTWSEGGGQLQSITNVAGQTWQDVSPAPVSPFVVPDYQKQGAGFFRVRQ